MLLFTPLQDQVGELVVGAAARRASAHDGAPCNRQCQHQSVARVACLPRRPSRPPPGPHPPVYNTDEQSQGSRASRPGATKETGMVAELTVVGRPLGRVE